MTEDKTGPSARASPAVKWKRITGRMQFTGLTPEEYAKRPQYPDYTGVCYLCHRVEGAPSLVIDIINDATVTRPLKVLSLATYFGTAEFDFEVCTECIYLIVQVRRDEPKKDALESEIAEHLKKPGTRRRS